MNDQIISRERLDAEEAQAKRGDSERNARLEYKLLGVQKAGRQERRPVLRPYEQRGAGRFPATATYDGNFRAKSWDNEEGTEKGRVYVGTLIQDGRDGRVLLQRPDSILGRSLKVPFKFLNGAPFGMLVTARLLSATPPVYAEVLEVLGEADCADAAVLGIIREQGLHERFPQKVLDAAQVFPLDPEEHEVEMEIARGRRDLRDLQTITIDGEDAKDLDDAIDLLHENDGTLQLYVHIADVTHYVKLGSDLDREARDRGNSVYLPGRVLPMYPPRLSNGLCSLNPDRPRLTLSCRLHMDQRGRVLDGEIFEAVIVSKRRSNYHEVQAILDGETVPDCPAWFTTQIYEMAELARALQELRTERGAIRFSSSETELTLDVEGKVEKIFPAEQSFSHELIESFMLAANEYVAAFCQRNQLAAVYRVHEQPDPDKLIQFEDLAKCLGYNCAVPLKPKPKDLQKILETLEDGQRDRILNDRLLRAMAKARYDRQNLGHFALAAKDYCHFTSPIRRYADDCVHRAVKAALHKRKYNPNAAETERIADWISATERAAVQAERDVTALKICEYYADRLGEELEGTIVGMTPTTLFVALDNTAEGAILFRDLPSYYHFDETRQQAVPQGRGPVFSLGDRLKVQIARVDVAKRMLDFHFIEQLTSLPLAPGAKRGFAERGGKGPKGGRGKRTARAAGRGAARTPGRAAARAFGGRAEGGRREGGRSEFTRREGSRTEAGRREAGRAEGAHGSRLTDKKKATAKKGNRHGSFHKANFNKRGGGRRSH